MYDINIKLALLCEVLIPENNKSSSLFQNVYTVTFHLRNEVDTVGVVLGFTKFLSDLEDSFKQLYEGFADFVGQFSSEELNAVHPEAQKLSLGQLLELILGVPLVLANVLARWKRKSKDEAIQPVISGLETLFSCLAHASSNAKAEQQQTKTMLQNDLRHAKKGFLHDLFHRPPQVDLSGDSHIFFGKLEGLRLALPLEPTRVRDVKLFVFSDVVLVVARELPTLLYSMDPGALVVSTRRELGVGDVAASLDCSFSLFWNKGGGKVEQLIMFASSRPGAHHAMSRILAASLCRVNSTRTKSFFMLVRERKPFQGDVHFLCYGHLFIFCDREIELVWCRVPFYSLVYWDRPNHSVGRRHRKSDPKVQISRAEKVCCFALRSERRACPSCVFWGKFRSFVIWRGLVGSASQAGRNSSG